MMRPISIHLDMQYPFPFEHCRGKQTLPIYSHLCIKNQEISHSFQIFYNYNLSPYYSYKMGRYAIEPDNATKAAKARGSNLRVHFKVSYCYIIFHCSTNKNLYKHNTM